MMIFDECCPESGTGKRVRGIAVSWGNAFAQAARGYAPPAFSFYTQPVKRACLLRKADLVRKMRRVRPCWTSEVYRVPENPYYNDFASAAWRQVSRRGPVPISAQGAAALYSDSGNVYSDSGHSCRSSPQVAAEVSDCRSRPRLNLI